jgi:hypothetical protein
MAHLGGVSRRNDMFFAKVDTQDSGVRYWMERKLLAQEHTQGFALASGLCHLRHGGFICDPTPHWQRGEGQGPIGWVVVLLAVDAAFFAHDVLQRAAAVQLFHDHARASASSSFFLGALECPIARAARERKHWASLRYRSKQQLRWSDMRHKALRWPYDQLRHMP